MEHFCFVVHLLNNMINLSKYTNLVHICSLVQLCAFVTRGCGSSGPGLTGDDNLEGVEGGILQLLNIFIVGEKVAWSLNCTE